MSSDDIKPQVGKYYRLHNGRVIQLLDIEETGLCLCGIKVLDGDHDFGVTWDELI